MEERGPNPSPVTPSSEQRTRMMSIAGIPWWLFVALSCCVLALSAQGALSSEISVMISTLAAGGAVCAWIGGIIPAFRRLGGPAIVAAFLPSYAVYHHWLPQTLVVSVTHFTKETNFIYLYVAVIVAGSILGMERSMLLRGIVKIFVPLIAGSLMALVAGSLVGATAGMPMSHVIPMLIVPIMAGGVGEGVLPLSLGYAEIFHRSQTEFLSQLLPVVLLANLAAIVLSGVLNTLGQRFPRFTGKGRIQPEAGSTPSERKRDASLTHEHIMAALLFGTGAYLVGMLAHRVIPLPAPVTMLLLMVALRLSNVIPAWLAEAARRVGRFTAATVTYPLLFAVAVSLTPWVAVREAMHPANLLLIVVVVAALTGTGFVVGRLVGLYPIESAIINACHTGSGGTGDVAILTAAERLDLMPFAQVATRIGGAITVALTLLILNMLTRSH